MTSRHALPVALLAALAVAAWVWRPSLAWADASSPGPAEVCEYLPDGAQCDFQGGSSYRCGYAVETIRKRPRRVRRCLSPEQAAAAASALALLPPPDPPAAPEKDEPKRPEPPPLPAAAPPLRALCAAAPAAGEAPRWLLAALLLAAARRVQRREKR